MIGNSHSATYPQVTWRITRSLPTCILIKEGPRELILGKEWHISCRKGEKELKSDFAQLVKPWSFHKFLLSCEFQRIDLDPYFLAPSDTKSFLPTGDMKVSYMNIPESFMELSIEASNRRKNNATSNRSSISARLVYYQQLSKNLS